MIRNYEEIKKAILEGKTNEEIIAERLEYWNSDESNPERENINKKIKKGFIRNGEKVAYDESSFGVYYIDEEEIFNLVLDIIRNKGEMPLDKIMKIVREYFSFDENGKYATLVKRIEDRYRMMDEKTRENEIREDLPRIIMAYEILKEKGYNLDQNEICDLYLTGEIYNMGVDRDCLEWEPKPISYMKGVGMNYAQCAEQAALTQNIVSFLGCNTYYITGMVGLENQQTEGHAYNILEKNGTFWLLDTALFNQGRVVNLNSEEDLSRNRKLRIIDENGNEKTYFLSNVPERENEVR